ncbi:MAG: hypothetical protein PHV34_10500 [Verrucomicrobiae bacterium]|nr:hypothetical protein [Verrucomicrobiae bacterium]
MNSPSKHLLFCLSLAAASLLAAGENDDANLAREKPYALDPAPNYKRCKDDGDAAQLTDGIRYRGPDQLWVQKECVGWICAELACVTITIDLGKVESVGKVVFHTAYDGPCNVDQPALIMAFVSDDGKNYSFGCELTRSDGKKSDPPIVRRNPFDGEALVQKLEFCKYSGVLQTPGRYVSILAHGDKFLFCDEIEIFRSEDSQKKQSNCLKGGLKSLWRTCLFNKRVKAQLLHDLREVQSNLLRLESNKQKAFAVRLDQLREGTLSAEWNDPGQDFRAVAPLNSLHREILQLNAGILRSAGAPPLMVWHKNRWAHLEPTEAPKKHPETPPALSVRMMNNEYRAETINITNTLQKPAILRLSFEGLPDCIHPHQVEFVGTTRHGMIADPLVPANFSSGAWEIHVPAGMTRQIWFSFHPRDIAAGKYAGSIRLRSDSSQKITIPLSLEIASRKFPDRPRLSLCMWDYTNKPHGFKCQTDRNVELAIKDLNAHFVDSVWAHCAVACWPQKGDFDQDGTLTKPLRTGLFDDWIKNHPDKRHYFFYLAKNNNVTFLDEPPGTPKFKRMVSQWAKAFSAHIEKAGIQPAQIGFDAIDEPGTTQEYENNRLWAEAIKSGEPRFRLFTDASGYEKENPALTNMLRAHDIICPRLDDYGRITSDMRTKAAIENGDGKTFWFYSCGTPQRAFDPYYYNRLQAWHCWKNGATGMGFWNYWNFYSENDLSAWNEYAANPGQGVVYSAPDTITTGKHWEAVREGVEDYECLAMLRDAIKRAKAAGSSPALAEAEKLLDTAPSEVTGDYQKKLITWFAPKDCEAADKARLRVLDALENLAKQTPK